MYSPEITSDNIVQRTLNEVPEFRPIYKKLAEREAEKKRGINQPQRVLYHLGYFAVHAVAKDKQPELEGPIYNDLDDLLLRIMKIIENAAMSSDSEVVAGVENGFLRVMYLMKKHQQEIMQYAGPKLLALMYMDDSE